MRGYLVCLGFLIGVSVLPVEGATYYVSTTGSDSQSCPAAQSAATPRRTINSGIACLSSGDTLIIGPGHYHEFLTTYSGVGASPIPSGSAGAHTTLKAAQPGTVTLTFTPFGDFWAPIELGDYSHHIQIEGIVIDGQQFTIPGGIGLGEGSYSHRFKDILIHHVEGMGINGTGSNHEFLNVSMHHIAYTDSGQSTCHHKTCSNPPGQLCPGYCHPYYIFGTGHLIDGGTYAHVDGWVFHWYATNSIIRNTCVQNALIGGGLIGGGTLFYNNVITDTAVGVFMTPGQTVVHNTIQGGTRLYGGERFGIYQQSGSANPIQNNLLQQRQGPYLMLDNGGSMSSSNVAGNMCDVAAPGCSSGMVAQSLVPGSYPQAGASGGGSCTAVGGVPPPVAQPPVLPPPRNLRVRLVP